MSVTTQYDSFLGGTQELPGELSLMRFAQARVREIKAMKQSLSATSGTKLAFQRLPKHMRRRAMSHNVKRLPRRLREIHLNQQKKSGVPPKQKRPSRKYRRRPANLLSEYERRKRRIGWLETHIWHAKRFRMVEKWGYRLGERPCDKAFRACYRATIKHCLIHDMSYLNCIELRGYIDLLLAGFKKMCDPRTGLTLAAKAFLDGKREGETTLFWNSNAIGTTYFNWKPESADMQTVWLWIHPAYYNEALNAMLECFSLEPIDSTSYTNKQSQIRLLELKNALNRFRLTGPLSLTVIENSLPGCIISPMAPCSISYTSVTDPRLERSKIDIPSVDSIWVKNAREKATASKLSTAAIGEMRQKLLVPGSSLPCNGELIPIALVHRPGSLKTGYGSSWDIIFPSGWGQPFWLSLIMNGARAGGLREFDSIRFEGGLLHFLAPDTSAGQEDEKCISENAKSTYFRLPPNKRPNYSKLAIASPFQFNWKKLLEEWHTSHMAVDEFSVLRHKQQLIYIHDLLEKRGKQSSCNIDYDQNCIVPVRIQSQRGTPKRFAIICLPDKTDLLSKKEPVERLRSDEKQSVRRETRLKHQALLKALRRKRIRAKQNGKILKPDTELRTKQAETMRNLWLPDGETIVNSCSKTVIGFVTFGGFSFTSAQGVGTGYIAMPSIPSLLASGRCKQILIRNTCSRQYRFGTLEVIL